MAKNRDSNALAAVFTNIADAARAAVIQEAMRDYKDIDSIIAPSPIEHILAKLLGTDTSFVYMFSQVVSGRIDGNALSGAEDCPGVILGQAIMMVKYGFLIHPALLSPAPIHPRALSKIKERAKPKGAGYEG